MAFQKIMRSVLLVLSVVLVVACSLASAKKGNRDGICKQPCDSNEDCALSEKCTECKAGRNGENVCLPPGKEKPVRLWQGAPRVYDCSFFYLRCR